MPRNYYRLNVPFDWEGANSFGVDITLGPDQGDRCFIPKSQCRFEEGGVYVSQWILERKRVEFESRGFDLDWINRGLSEVFDWGSVLCEPGEQAAVEKVDASKIRDAFDAAAEHLKYPKFVTAVDGHIVKFKRSGDRSKNPGVVYIDNGAEWGSPARLYFGAIHRDGTFVPARSCPETVRDLMLDLSVDFAVAAGQQGRELGSCCFCSRELSDERSTKVGYGPICADHYGLPWGE